MGTPLHRTLADELRTRIRSGAIGVGEALPSEAELCREFSASRGPVRQALAALRDEGLIGGGQGRRTCDEEKGRRARPCLGWGRAIR